MSSRSLSTPAGLIRGLDSPAAVLQAGRVVASNEALRRALGRDGDPDLDDVTAPDARASTRAWLRAALVASAPAGPHGSRLLGAGARPIDVELSYLPLAGRGELALLLVRLLDPLAIRYGILAEIRGRFEQIIDAAEELVVVHAIDGSILLANLAAQRLVGRSESELLQANIKDFIPASQHAAVRERAATRVAGVSDRTYSYEVTAIDASGTERRLAIVSGPILAEGEPVAVLVIGRFRDEERRREQDLARERDAAVAANQAKREFLAHLSHEVRTPMNVIFGMTDMALDLPLSDEARHCVARARDAAGTLLNLVEDVLQFSRAEARKYVMRPRPFDLRERVGATVEGLSSLALGRGLAIETEIAPDVPEVLVGDPDRLHQVLSNLLTNAIKFTPEGRVGVRVGRASSATPDGHHLRFAVFDSGVGLTVEQRAKIFDPFLQVHRPQDPGEGTGLGLAIARELVALLGGQIWVESEPGRGSTFYFDAVFAEG